MLVYFMALDLPEEKSLFEKIYYEYRGVLFKIAMSYLHNEFDAEDAVHQTFMYAAENMKKFSFGVCPKTLSYLVKTVRCKATDILRHRHRHRTGDSATLVPDSESFYPGLSPLAACIAKLPEQYRDALILRMHYGFEFREIAKMMNITESNARKLVTRARNKLEDICQKEGIL